MQGQLGEWELGFCHSLECGRGKTSDSFAWSICSPSFLCFIKSPPPSSSSQKILRPREMSRRRKEELGARDEQYPPHKCKP